ncbi:MAG: hypothetical protein Q4E24_13935 [bacterium]|nr:hypothetical protein [bacterium]
MGTFDKEQKIDDIVAMIDQFMAGNGGHMNIQVNNSGTITAEKTVQTTNSLECAAGDMACKVPTLFEGMDFEEMDSRPEEEYPEESQEEQ